MAASTGPRESAKKDGELIAYPVAAGVTINKGTLVSLDTTTGYARPSRSGTATDVFLGVSFETCNNSAGAAGAAMCRVEKAGSYLFAKNAATAQTDLAQPAYAADDQTVTLTATSNVQVGFICGIMDAVNVRVRIGRGVQ